GSCPLRGGAPLADLCAGLARAVAIGRTGFDSGEGERCIQTIAALDCARIVTTSPPLDVGSLRPCAAAAVGFGDDNGECGGDRDCVTADYCDPPGACVGTCVPRATVGSSCA